MYIATLLRSIETLPAVGHPLTFEHGGCISIEDQVLRMLTDKALALPNCGPS
jgi:hypothetical protein